MICNFYKLCKEGKQEEVREKIQKLPKAALNNCARADSDEELEVCVQKKWFYHY